MWRKNVPGHPCCDCPCEIAKDGLSGSPLSDTWTLKIGDWDTISTDSGYTTTSDANELWHKTPHPDGPYPSDVRLRVRGATGAVLRIILSASGDVASGDALIVELTPGEHCGTLKLYQRLDGVEDLLATQSVYGAIVDEWHDLRGCYDPETEVFTGSVLPHDGTYWSQVSADVDAHTDGEYAGFASGTSDQSDFDTFVYRKLWYDKVVTPQCSVLTIEQLPPEIIVPAWTPVTGETWSITMTFDATGTVVGTFTANFFSGATSTIYAADVEAYLDPWLAGNFTAVGVTITGDSDTGMSFQFSDPLNEYNRVHVVVQREDPLPVVVGTDAYIKDYWYLAVVTEGQKQFQLSYDGQTTSTLSTDTSDATIEAALQSLSTTGSGNILVDGPDGGPWGIYWAGALAETVTWPITVVTNLNDCDPSYSQTERVTCSTCRFCCLFSPPYDNGCGVTVKSGTWEIESTGRGAMTGISGLSGSNRNCDEAWGEWYKSSGAGEFEVTNKLPANKPYSVRGHFQNADGLVSFGTYRLDFANGDSVVVTWDGTTLTLVLNGTETYSSTSFNSPGGVEVLVIQFCRVSETVCRVEAGIAVGSFDSVYAIECGGIYTSLASSWDETTVSTTVTEETRVNLSATVSIADCGRCSGCACRPKIGTALELDFTVDPGVVCGEFPTSATVIKLNPDVVLTPPLGGLPNKIYEFTIAPTDCKFSGIIDQWQYPAGKSLLILAIIGIDGLGRVGVVVFVLTYDVAWNDTPIYGYYSSEATACADLGSTIDLTLRHGDRYDGGYQLTVWGPTSGDITDFPSPSVDGVCVTSLPETIRVTFL